MTASFLDEMARGSAERVAAAKARRSIGELARLVASLPPPAAPRWSREGFDLIGEVKFRSPASGVLGEAATTEAAVARARSYAGGGVAAISVVTEPLRFDGDIAHLSAVASAVAMPVLRKDFLVDPYQVLEAREAGAAGALLIVRMLPGSRLREMIDAAREAGVFVLLESFDEDDLERAAACADVSSGSSPQVLLGVNARDLTSLKIDRDRLARIARRLPPGSFCVAESGIHDKDGVEDAAARGYRAALVGTALMRSDAPGRLAADLLAAGRARRAVEASR